MSANDTIRRQLSSGMVGSHYDMTQQASAVFLKDGILDLGPGESAYGFTNPFVTRAKLVIRDFKLQRYIFPGDAS
jgi:hypothetical protein